MANVHKDFHGAMSYGLKYVYENYGKQGVKQYLTNLANTIYSPLSKDLAENGLKGLEKHWKKSLTWKVLIMNFSIKIMCLI